MAGLSYLFTSITNPRQRQYGAIRSEEIEHYLDCLKNV